MFPSVFIRFIRGSCILLALVGATSLSAQDLTLTPVTIGWRDAASFKRISEYFDGRENTGGITTLRTHADQRAGYYFMMRAENPGATVAAQIVIQVILPTDQKIQRHTFNATLAAPKTLVHLGLTGPAWPGEKINPVAWKIDITTTDGRLLASDKSYLWDKPPGK
jgi:hypothetical protein